MKRSTRACIGAVLLALASAELSSAQKLATLGYESVGYGPDEFATFWKTEFDKWGKVVKASGARID